MNLDDLRSLADRAESVRGRPETRLTEVRARIRSARRRRAVEVVGGTSAAVLALVVGVALLTGPAGQKKVDGPLPPAASETPAKIVRKIVYSDRQVSIPNRARTALGRVVTIQVGDRLVRIDQIVRTVQSWALRVTDGGAVYAKDDHSVWLTDGGEPRRIAVQACVDTTQYNGIAVGNTGPRAAWFDCSPASRGADLVVFDTVTGREVARHPIPSCRGRRATWLALKCDPYDVVGDHVYYHARYGDDFVLDLLSGTVAAATPAVHAEDVQTHPRGLVVGDSWQAGHPVTGIGQIFRVVGPRLVAELNLDSEQVLAKATFDTATRRAVRLRLPSGYRAVRTDPAERPIFILFEWLDDETVALTRANTDTYLGDILTCHLSDGRCEVAVKAPGGDATRIVAHLWPPG